MTQPVTLADLAPALDTRLAQALEAMHRAIEDIDEAQAIIHARPLGALIPQGEGEELRRRLRAAKQRLFNIAGAP